MYNVEKMAPFLKNVFLFSARCCHPKPFYELLMLLDNVRLIIVKSNAKIDLQRNVFVMPLNLCTARLRVQQVITALHLAKYSPGCFTELKSQTLNLI